jgi:MoaA/NifB/PqqE/SkfB family radical SAM enzyme
MNRAMNPVPLPSFVQIEPVGTCNLRCRMCPVHLRSDAEGAPPLMPFDAFRRLLAQFPALTELHLQGLGEPMMHPRFFDMVRYAADRGIRVSTNSNLTLLTPARADLAIASGLHEISVSIDAATPETYAWIRVGANLGKVLRNLDRLLSSRARAGSDLPHVRIVMVLMRSNLCELAPMVRLTHQTGANVLFVQQLCHDFGETRLPLAYLSMRQFIDGEALGEPDRPAMERAYAEARAEAGRLGVTLRLPRPTARESGNRQRCDWPWRGAYISHGGEAMPCCMVATPERAPMGNMVREGVHHVWNGAAYAGIRDGLAGGTPAEICRSCALYKGTF